MCFARCVILLTTIKLCLAKDVIVVGAGISGLAAARRLVDYGGINVKILEARPDRYGGRIFTDWDAHGGNIPLDFGAGWMHGAGEDNPLVGLAKNNSITMFSTDTVKGTRWSSDNFTAYDDDVYIQTGVEFIDMMFSVSEMSKAWQEDKSLAEAITMTSFSMTASHPLMQLFTSSIVIAGTGADVDSISAKYLDAGESFEGPETVLPRGMSQLTDSIVEGKNGKRSLVVNLGKEVRKITYSDNRVQVKTEDGEVYKADSVIVTVPLSILQADMIEFQPPLSSERISAINKLGFGVFNKLFLEFDELFWDPDEHYFGLAPVNKSDMGLLNTWFNMYVITQRPILVGFLAGQNAADFESWTDDHVLQIAMDVLSGMFGEVVHNRTVKFITRSRWLNDLHSRGAYSYYPVGCTPEHRRIASEPIEQYIYFAGEHTDIDFFGSIHGAYMSGKAVADKIIESMLPANNNPKNNNTKDKVSEKHVSHAPGVIATKYSSSATTTLPVSLILTVSTLFITTIIINRFPVLNV